MEEIIPCRSPCHRLALSSSGPRLERARPLVYFSSFLDCFSGQESRCGVSGQSDLARVRPSEFLRDSVQAILAEFRPETAVLNSHSCNWFYGNFSRWSRSVFFSLLAEFVEPHDC